MPTCLVCRLTSGTKPSLPKKAATAGVHMEHDHCTAMPTSQSIECFWEDSMPHSYTTGSSSAPAAPAHWAAGSAGWSQSSRSSSRPATRAARPAGRWPEGGEQQVGQAALVAAWRAAAALLQRARPALATRPSPARPMSFLVSSLRQATWHPLITPPASSAAAFCPHLRLDVHQIEELAPPRHHNLRGSSSTTGAGERQQGFRGIAAQPKGSVCTDR